MRVKKPVCPFCKSETLVYDSKTDEYSCPYCTRVISRLEYENIEWGI